MWYAQGTSYNHSIWLANRDDPIADDSGVLVLDDTGLKITRIGGNPIQLFSLQSTSITINTSDMKAVLQDSGNLVLQGTNEENRENVVLWQSFDYPTDSFLPGMKLGDICWEDCKCLGVAVQDLGCRFLLGYYEEGVSYGDSFEVINRNRPKEYLLDLMTSEDANNVSELQTGNNGRNLNIYTAALIMSATNGFSPDNLLGKGGFGPVFKGALDDGQEVAIKRLSSGSSQGLVEFKNELILIAKLQHTNLVRLLGFCVQGEEKMLVYEYMPNKSLDTFIFDDSKRKLLNWDKRFSIIEGIAQGLLYLHKYSRLRIIHRDLKLSNILLDENMNPKISDFGLARIYKTSEAGSNTNRIVGTYGYMSPEYAMEGIFSEKSDVYSFGVMVLEVVSGRKNSSHFEFDRPLNLVGYVSSYHILAVVSID
ncbi:hypothetical protein Gogos_005075 [Gossypium gossypioides]|uniref:Protein kinase domain-containing protein n=1 Tax=Gossypium gossypioides TaxID=34282 RepID=A0A7J9CI69_GOSGO|nr:hypothetical protein [Gossypium gossypioides]